MVFSSFLWLLQGQAFHTPTEISRTSFPPSPDGMHRHTRPRPDTMLVTPRSVQSYPSRVSQLSGDRPADSCRYSAVRAPVAMGTERRSPQTTAHTQSLSMPTQTHSLPTHCPPTVHPTHCPLTAHTLPPSHHAEEGLPTPPSSVLFLASRHCQLPAGFRDSHSPSCSWDAHQPPLVC